MPNDHASLGALIERHQETLVSGWLAAQKRYGRLRDTANAATGADQARQFVDQLHRGAAAGHLDDITAPEWGQMRDLLEDLSRALVAEGFSPSETATFVFSIKEPLYDLLRREFGKDAEQIATQTWAVTRLVDRLGLFTVECHARTREEMIMRQQQELLELSTPVVQLWDGILALPLIGTLDSARTQIVMESLLERIVSSGAEIAIIDITGVPTVDTLVAQHLIKTISAARLMGADCVLSGIRPQIAQTIVHLGLELNVISKATMADALGLALRRTGRAIVKRETPAAGTTTT
ncbi:MAG TPA: STAS domain-containing protein [Acetobacteraceae bacterium]|jgi:rsbT co-antagonist protein RsbR|nr:STAS domain-containing protein [Acetobacteraceae bacterium]